MGTLTLLRWIMLFQALEEGGATPPRFPTAKWVMEQASAGLEKMTKTRSARLQSLEAMYMQAELVIGRGTGKRRGFLTTQRKCDTNVGFSMPVGNRDVRCYPYWFHNYLGNTYPSMEHRRQTLPKLFPKDRAQHYVDLVTRYVMAAPSPYEPSLTLAMPQGSGYAMPGPDYCKPYGGDRNGNGLCDGWEKPLSKTATAESSTGGSNVVCKGSDTAKSIATSFYSNHAFANTLAIAGYCSEIHRRNTLAWLSPNATTQSTKAVANSNVTSSGPASALPAAAASTRADLNSKAVDRDLGAGYAKDAFSRLTRQDLADAGLPMKACVISAHGNPDGIFINNETPILLFKLARDIMKSCPPDEPVVLLSCETGRPKTDGTVPVAQLLALALKNEGRQNTTVWAPNTRIIADRTIPPFSDPFINFNERWEPENYPNTPTTGVHPQFIPYNAK